MKRSLIFQLILVGASLLVLIYVAFAPRVQREVPTRIILETDDRRIVVGAPLPVVDEPTTETLTQSDVAAEAEEPVEDAAGMGGLARAAMETSYNPETTYNSGTADPGTVEQAPPPATP